MKKTIAIILIALIALTSAFANGAAEKDDNTIVVGATPDPHAAMLEVVKEDLAAQGFNLVIREFTDYNIPNEAVASGELDANFFQHIPYLNSQNETRGYDLVNCGGIHIEPLALYSKQWKALDDIPVKAKIAIPNDPTNEGRALLLLQDAGLITLRADAGLEATPNDIVDNPRNLRFTEIDAANLPRILSDVDAAVINGNYSIPAGLIASRDGLFVEGANSPYVNVVACNRGHENDPAIIALVNALKSDKVKAYIAERYPEGQVVLVP